MQNNNESLNIFGIFLPGTVVFLENQLVCIIVKSNKENVEYIDRFSLGVSLDNKIWMWRPDCQYKIETKPIKEFCELFKIDSSASLELTMNSVNSLAKLLEGKPKQ